MQVEQIKDINEDREMQIQLIMDIKVGEGGFGDIG